MRPIRVLVLDDSAAMQKLLSSLIAAERDMVVVGAASDPVAAREMIRDLGPDVLTLDMEMPRFPALAFLEKLMRATPMPVVMVSALADRSAPTALEAFGLGALELVAKPRRGATNVREYGAEVCASIRAAFAARAQCARPAAGEAFPRVAPSARGGRVIVIGASTGGTEAIRAVLTPLPPNAPPVLVTQHMPEGFTRAFAARLDALCAMRVSEARDGEPVLPGRIYVAPGHSHLTLEAVDRGYVTLLAQSPPVNRHRPSVDVLFRSAARAAGADALGVILTGMGKDGASGMLELRRAGAYTVAQDERSCVVFGMPKEAIGRGGVSEVLALEDIAPALLGRLAAAAGRRLRDEAQAGPAGGR